MSCNKNYYYFSLDMKRGGVMSYGRNPYYIFSDGEYIIFDGKYKVPEIMLNALLYKLLLACNRDDLRERLQEGREVWLHQTRLINKRTGMPPISTDEFKEELIEVEIPLDDPEMQEYIQWMQENEDEILKHLMGEASFK